MKSIHYVIVKDNILGNKAKISKKQLQGYQVTPKNTQRYGVGDINSMTLINPSFIEKILKKKIKRKLDFYLKYIVSLIESDEDNSSDNDPSNLDIALNDLTHYKSIIEYKYRKYLDEKYINLLLKKIDILENEIQRKLQVQQYRYYEKIYEESYENEYEEEKGKSR